MPKSQADSLKGLILITPAIDGSSNAMLKLLPGLIPQHIQGAIFQLHIKPFILIGLMIQPEIIHGA